MHKCYKDDISKKVKLNENLMHLLNLNLFMLLLLSNFF